eukprot:2276613-Karenia_brevis.AAC.1
MEQALKNPNTLLNFVANPHRADTKAHAHFENVRDAKSVKEAKERSASVWDLRSWVEKGSLKVMEAGEARRDTETTGG